MAKVAKTKHPSHRRGGEGWCMGVDYSHYPLMSETSHFIYLSVTLEISPLS